MTYGRVKAPITPPFRPDFVRNDKIVLSFSGFFRQKVHETNQRQYDRIRYVKVMYFMEDDTMTVIEPPIFVSITKLSKYFLSQSFEDVFSFNLRIAAIRKAELFVGHAFSKTHNGSYIIRGRI